MSISLIVKRALPAAEARPVWTGLSGTGPSAPARLHRPLCTDLSCKDHALSLVARRPILYLLRMTHPTDPPVLARAPNSNLMRLLDRVEAETGDGQVSVRDVLEVLGSRAFTPMLLIPCLALVSPVSAIPGVPTFLSLLVGLVAVQMLFGRQSGETLIWLPHFLLDRSIDAGRLSRAIAFCGARSESSIRGSTSASPGSPTSPATCPRW